MSEITRRDTDVNAIMTMADQAFKSKYFEKIGGQSAIFVIMARAREIGMPEFEAIMGGMNIIQGKVEISPRSMNSMIRRAGHKVEILHCDHLSCKLKGVRKDTGESLIVIFTIEDAKRAGIHKGAWITYPDDMCFKSALSKLARRLFADVISTAYVEGEIAQERTEVIHIEEPKVSPIEQPQSLPIEAKIETVEIEYLTHDQIVELDKLIGKDEDLLDRVVKAMNVTYLSQIQKKDFETVRKKLQMSINPSL